MNAITLGVVLPVMIWMWRSELVSLVSDCIAIGIRKSREGEQ